MPAMPLMPGGRERNQDSIVCQHEDDAESADGESDKFCGHGGCIGKLTKNVYDYKSETDFTVTPDNRLVYSLRQIGWAKGER